MKVRLIKALFLSYSVFFLSLSPKPLLDKTLPVYISVNASYSDNDISNHIVRILHRKGYECLNEETVKKLTQTNFDNGNITFFDEEGKNVFFKNKAIYQLAKFKIIFEIDSTTKNIKMDSASVKILPYPSYFNNSRNYPEISLSKNQLQAMEFNDVVTLLIDTVTTHQTRSLSKH
jgi:hypothetical protein